MAVNFSCECGASIRLPERAAGRKARCSSCGKVFTVPAPPPSPPTTTPAEDPSGPGDWLIEFAREADRAPSVILPPAPPMPFADDPPPPPPRHKREDDGDRRDSAMQGISGPERSYWADLLNAFAFPFTSEAWITLGLLTIFSVGAGVLGFMPLLGCFFYVVVAGYLAAFFMNTIRDTAAGEDDLPEVWMSSFFSDLLLPLLQFVLTWVVVLLPALVLLIYSLAQLEDTNSVLAFADTVPIFWILALATVGLFLWPAVILITAIGGSIRSVWPQTVIMTVARAPLAYLSMCAVLLVSAAGWVFFSSGALDELAAKSPVGGGTVRMAVLLALVAGIFKLYTAVVAMKAIGLFYRHHKRKFPWVAE